MRIAIFGKNFSDRFHPGIKELYHIFEEKQTQVLIYEPFHQFICSLSLDLPKIQFSTFTSFDDIDRQTDLMISIGGDGTFLETITYIRNLGIPIIGINTGRLGFLANIAQPEIKTALESIFNHEYSYEPRSLLHLKGSAGNFADFRYALNEVTVQKEGSNMITVKVYLNNDLLNIYWTDGLIISTPTGSTAYSLSVGGPIATPDCSNFIISPIASHNLSVRPIVIPDHYNLKLKVESRDKQFLLTLDSRTEVVEQPLELEISKSDFFIRMLKLKNTKFPATLRNKLLWGADKRN